MFKSLQLVVAFIAFLILPSSDVYSQTKGPGNWWIYLGNNKIAPSWNWHNEVQYRNFNFVGDLEQLLLRTGIGYDLSPANNNVMLGAAYVLSGQIGKSNKGLSSELRFFGQLITKQNFGRYYLSHRYRLEQRNFAAQQAWRGRYSLGVNVPLNTPTIQPGSFYLNLYNEIFVNFQSEYFDRNRVYGAIGYQISPWLKAEVGYMTQLLNQRNTQQFQILFSNNLPFS